MLACFLAQKKFRVKLYERRGDMRKTQMSAGRSINLALSKRGLTALGEIGLDKEILEMTIPMYGRMIHPHDGEAAFQQYSKDGKSAIHSVSRGDLNCKFMTLAEQDGVEIFFDHKCLHVDFENSKVSFLDEVSKKEYEVSGQTILATDGAYSLARLSMTKMPRYDYSQTYLSHGYKELHIPPGPNGEHLLNLKALHIWPRGTYMMIALPNMDGSFTVTCFFPYEGEHGFNRLDHADDETILNFFHADFKDAAELMPDLLENWRNNPTSSLLTIKCFPWSVEGSCCLLGDASHAIVPFFGQGMNAGFEDCHIFAKILSEYSGDEWADVFKKFQDERKTNTDAIADMAQENFIEMRDSVADPEFQFRKKVQQLLGTEFPGVFNSRYEWVSFSNVPYSEAKRLGHVNDQIVEELVEGIGHDMSKIDLGKARDLIKKYFPQHRL